MAPGFAVSPDGTHLAIQVRRADPTTNSYCHALLLCDLRTPSHPPIAINTGGELVLDRFSLYGLQNFRSGIVAPLTPQWSSDARWIAFLRRDDGVTRLRSEEHTSELQSLMRISYAVFCLKQKKQ